MTLFMQHTKTGISDSWGDDRGKWDGFKRDIGDREIILNYTIDERSIVIQ